MTDSDEMFLRVLVVADNPLARVGLVSLLQDHDACTIVGQVAYDDAFLENLDIYQPDIILWDMTWEMVPDMPVLSDLIDSGLNVVALISDVEQARDVWNAGVAGILMQNADAQRIATALIAISQGLAVLDRSVVESTTGPTTEAMIESLAEPLTAREAEVLNLVAEGLSNKAIAYQLGISDHTVKFHVTAIMTKLAAQSRTEAVVKATRLGLIHL